MTGGAEEATGEAWRALGETRTPLTTGMKLRTLAGGRVALALAGGGSLRLDAETEVMLDAPGRLYVRHGTIYVDSGARPGATRLQIVTPAGTARDIGTQFELQVAGSAMRLRVREGSVSIDRGGQSLTGSRGRADRDRRPRRHLARCHRGRCRGMAMGRIHRADAGHGRQAGRRADRVGCA